MVSKLLVVVIFVMVAEVVLVQVQQIALFVGADFFAQFASQQKADTVGQARSAKQIVSDHQRADAALTQASKQIVEGFDSPWIEAGRWFIQ